VVCQLGANARPQFNTASPVHLAHLDQQATMENPVLPDPKDNLDLLDPQPILAQNPTVRASPAHLALLAHLDPTDNPDQWDQVANPVPMASPDPADLPDQQDLPEMLDHLETQDPTDNLDLPAKTANACTTPPDPKDPMDLPDLEARTAIPDQPVNLASPDQWDPLAKPEIQDIQDKTVNQDLPVDPVFPERTPTIVLALTALPSSSRKWPPSTLKLLNDCSPNDLILNLDLNRTILFCNFSPVVIAVMLFRMMQLKVDTRKGELW